MIEIVITFFKTITRLLENHFYDYLNHFNNYLDHLYDYFNHLHAHFNHSLIEPIVLLDHASTIFLILKKKLFIPPNLD